MDDIRGKIPGGYGTGMCGAWYYLSGFDFGMDRVRERGICDWMEDDETDNVKAWADANPKELSDMLVRAACLGKLEYVELFLSYPKCDPKSHASQALRYAAQNGHDKVVERLIPVSDPLARRSAAIRNAISRDHIQCLELLLPVSDLRDAAKADPGPDARQVLARWHAAKEREELDRVIEPSPAGKKTRRL